ncbi:MAG: tripartite tricarboxylate transporter permease [Burkholderiaceae bacterium]
MLARWALEFGPSHLFWMAILGVTVIGTLDSKSVGKGMLSGCLGMWLSTIGYDDIQGVERFVFTDALTGGVNIIAALIGLFAIRKSSTCSRRAAGRSTSRPSRPAPPDLGRDSRNGGASAGR